MSYSSSYSSADVLKLSAENLIAIIKFRQIWTASKSKPQPFSPATSNYALTNSAIGSGLSVLVNKVSRLQQTLADRDNTICDLQTALRLNKQVIEDLSAKLSRQSASLREHKRKDSWWNSKSSSKLNHTSKAVKNDLLNLSASSLQTDLWNSLNSLIKENISKYSISFMHFSLANSFSKIYEFLIYFQD